MATKIKTPYQTVKELSGGKQKLAESLAGALPRREGESKDALAKRLAHVSNRKLLRLQARLAAKPAK